jgi:glycosyltransferase involved in cell wall biosynthesis
MAREKTNLPIDKKIILFGADGGCQNKLKGFYLLKQSLDFFVSRYSAKNIEFVIFGEKRSKTTGNINGISIRDVGRINDDKQLSNLYNAADVFVIPSMIDNLPNTVMESLSCGTPCVGFAIGGIPDMINHKINGFLSEPFDIKSLAEGIHWVIADENRRVKLGEEARCKAEMVYSYTAVAKEYISLYNTVKSNCVLHGEA